MNNKIKISFTITMPDNRYIQMPADINFEFPADFTKAQKKLYADTLFAFLEEALASGKDNPFHAGTLSVVKTASDRIIDHIRSQKMVTKLVSKGA
jgi:hypothetical protein